MSTDTVIDIKHLYKISDRNGGYIGLLPKVSSDFGYSQQLNSGSLVVELDITVSASIDTASLSPTPVLDETGAVVLDETGAVVYDEHAPEVIGDNTADSLIEEDNIVEVVEFSPYDPNGVTVYKGYISQTTGNLANGDNVEIVCLTRGQDADQIEIPGDVEDTVDQSQLEDDGDVGFGIQPWQTFVIGAGTPNLSSFIAKLSAISSPVWVTLYLFRGGPDLNFDNAIAVTAQLVTGPTPTLYKFILPTAIPVNPGDVYTAFLYDGSPNGANSNFLTEVSISGGNTPAYAGGAFGFWAKSGNTGQPLWITIDNVSLYFETTYSHLTTEHSYSDTTDVSEILTDIMNSYNARGGALQIPVGGYDLTAILTAYTFKLNTTLEGANKVIDLGPADWHLYADVATEELQYKQNNIVADFTLLKGRHIDDLKLTSSKEEIINVCYLTGGPDETGDNNVFVKVVDAQSLSSNRIGLERLTDNRAQGVDGPNIAQLLAQNYINRHNSKTYNTTVTIPYSSTDIKKFKLGMMLDFGNFGTQYDGLLLQIVAIQRLRDQVSLSLGTLPRRDDKRVEVLNRQLNDVQTLANPDSPS